MANDNDYENVWDKIDFCNTVKVWYKTFKEQQYLSHAKARSGDKAVSPILYDWLQW